MPHVRICAGGAGRPAFLPRPLKSRRNQATNCMERRRVKRLRYVRRKASVIISENCCVEMQVSLPSPERAASVQEIHTLTECPKSK